MWSYFIFFLSRATLLRLRVSVLVAFLHNIDIVHADIRATNVFFTQWKSRDDLPAAKLGDLGLVKDTDFGTYDIHDASPWPLMHRITFFIIC